MAYRLQDQKIIPGGLNLLAPGDAVAAGDCLDLTGWWPGAAGRLEQGPTHDLRNSPSVTSTQDSLCQSDGRIYYGGGGNLRQIGRIGEAPIDSGYDGQPLGLLAYQGFCWIMNRSKQRKDNGTTTSDWTPAPPAAPALSIGTLASGALAVAECDPVNPDSNGDFQGINLYTTASIAGVEVGGQVTIAGCPAGSTAMNGTWPVLAVFSGGQNLIQLKASTPAATVFTVAGGITFTFAAVGMPLGDYLYWITWQYTDLGESNPSVLAGTAITVSDAGSYVDVDASAAIAAVPAGVTGWNIYRQGNGLATPYRLNENLLPLIRTFVYDYGDAIHTHSDAQLLSLGIILEADHDPAPPARVVANQVYNGRIVVANSAANPNRIWYSPALQPSFFRGAANPVAGDWVDVGTDRGDEIRAMTVRPGIVVIYRSKSIWRHLGDFGDVNARLECVVPDMGTVSYRGVVSTGLGDYYAWTDGVYKFNNDWGQKLSAKIEPLFLGKVPESVPALDTSNRDQIGVGFKNGRLWVSYPLAGASNGGTVIYHVDSQRWFSYSLGYRAFLDTGGELLAAGPGVYAPEAVYVGGATTLVFQSEYQDCGLPDREKTFADLVLDHNTQGVTLTVEIRTNKNRGVADLFTLTTINSIVLTKQIIPLIYPVSHALAGLPIRAYNLSVRITGNGGQPAPIIIDTPLLLHYYVEARRAKSFDSDETSHGSQGVKQVDQVEFDIDARSGDAHVTVYSDIPGGAMVNRTTVTIARTTTRQIRRVVLPAPIDGNLLRYAGTTDTDMQIYAARARVLPIGVYLDGTLGEFWQPQPISIGV